MRAFLRDHPRPDPRGRDCWPTSACGSGPPTSSNSARPPWRAFPPPRRARTAARQRAGSHRPGQFRRPGPDPRRGGRAAGIAQTTPIWPGASTRPRASASVWSPAVVAVETARRRTAGWRGCIRGRRRPARPRPAWRAWATPARPGLFGELASMAASPWRASRSGRRRARASWPSARPTGRLHRRHGRRPRRLPGPGGRAHGRAMAGARRRAARGAWPPGSIIWPTSGAPRPARCEPMAMGSRAYLAFLERTGARA